MEEIPDCSTLANRTKASGQEDRGLLSTSLLVEFGYQGTLLNPKLRQFSFVPLGFVPLGFGSLNHAIWPSIRVFGTQNLGVQTLRVQT